MSEGKVYFRQLRLPDIGCASYIAGGERVCAVIDPRWDAVPQYVGLARQQGLQITHIIETHTHADHVSGATRLAARTGATILIHCNALVTYPHCDVDDNEEIVIGPARILVLHTPGHSLDSISLLVCDVEGKETPRLLSGDTLFVGEVGRPDLHGNQAASLAELLYTSLHERILPLGDDIEVYPAHLAGSLCGRHIAPEPSTTIGRERRTNPALALFERETFVRSIVADLPPRPPNVERIVHLNRYAAPARRQEVSRVTPEEAIALLDQVAILDGRDAPVFAHGHLRGAINIPIGYGQFGVMAAWLFPPETVLLLITADDEDLVDAIDSLMVVGMTNPLSALTGDQVEWKGAGLAIAETPLVNVEDLAHRIATGKVGTLIDVREKGEMEQGTIAGAINLPYREIRTCETLPSLAEPAAVFCNSGNRSSVAASLLERLGLSVMNVAGGTTAWMEAGLPLAQPVFGVLLEGGHLMQTSKGSSEHTTLDQHPGMLVHQTYPLNVGAPLELIRQALVTPQECFFVRNHGAVPHVNVHRYRLAVTGKVQVPLALSLDELRAHFPSSTLMATLQCAGHRRNELAAIHPIPGEIPWGAETIGNAVWRGVALREVLLAAGVGSEVRHVAFLGLDAIHKGRERFAFGGSIPIKKAMSAEVLLAYEMNGQPLAPGHGFPLRVLVPGYIGARSVKWLASIVLQDAPSTNYYQARAYKLFPPHIQAESADWTQGQMLGALPLNSVIFRPCEGELLKAEPICIQGYAVAGEGHSIERVELSSDGGATWTNATLLERPQPWTWCFWEVTVLLDPGAHQLIVRARDSAACTQPEDVRQVWNWKGYVNNAWHRINVVIH